MSRRTPVQPTVSDQYVKSPLQLEQWAAYEAITARRAKEKEAQNAIAQGKTAADDAAATLYEGYRRWQRSQHIREFVDKTMSLLPEDSSSEALERAKKWQAWAMELADKTDPALIQVEKFLHPDPL